MTSFEEYEVLKILGTNINSSCYKVKNKTTSEVFIWKAINCENLSINKEDLLCKVSERIKLVNKSLLKCCDYIYHEETCTIYLVTEFCEYGTLENLIQTCLKNDERLCENFIWILLYKIACFLKTNNEVNAKLQEIFINSEFEVKFLHFKLHNLDGHNFLDLGKIAYLLINQQVSYNNDNNFPEYYSNELKALLTYLNNTEDDLKSRVDAILCHPTALVKLTSYVNKDIFIKTTTKLVDSIVNKPNDNSQIYRKKLENLRKREASLKANEEVLEEKNRKLINREKKVALMERVVKEKVAQAELYLKRAKDLRSNSSGSGKSTTTTTKKIYDNTDVSYSADCGDNSILPTSKKLNVKEIIKPQKFTRTMSERRVRFKSHSPLKEIHNIKYEFSKKKHFPDIKEEGKKTSKLVPNPSDSEKTSESNSEKCVQDGKKKFIFASMFKKQKRPNSIASSSDSVSAHTYEDIEQRGWEDFKEDLQDCKPINWNDESKRQAFDLLRIMNSECNVEQIKHTYL